MANSIGGETAKIFEFPAGGRSRPASGMKHDEATRTGTVATLRLPDMIVGSAWYHEAAVRDADQAGKR